MYNHKRARSEHERRVSDKKMWQQSYKLTQELEKKIKKIPSEKMEAFLISYRGLFKGVKHQSTKSSKTFNAEKQWVSMFNTLEKNLVKYPNRYNAEKKAHGAVKLFKIACVNKF